MRVPEKRRGYLEGDLGIMTDAQIEMEISEVEDYHGLAAHHVRARGPGA